MVEPGWAEWFGVPLLGFEAGPGAVPVDGEDVAVGVPGDDDPVLGGADWAGVWFGLVVFCPGVVVRLPVAGSVVLRGGVRTPVVVPGVVPGVERSLGAVVPGVLPGVERPPGVVFPRGFRGEVPSPGVVLPGVR